jgi:hypothetical protein
MKIVRGNYPGASEFAFFNRDVREMNLEECRGLLECILQRAMPGENNADVMYHELELAEELWNDGGP